MNWILKILRSLKRSFIFYFFLFISFLFLKCMKVQTYLRHFVANLVVSCDWLMML
jgi:hypothetical protein